ncbi:MAG: MarR family transcriptional regulator [Anaerolineae bacterium]|nr:MarR family transcriptional regulator [Anaerolineae bacterium]
MAARREGGFLIAKIHQLAGRIFAQKLKAHQIDEINPAQGRILFVLWEQDGISISELAWKTSLSKSTLTSMLDRLEAAGHIERVSSPEDRRSILICRTDQDRVLQEKYNWVSQEMIELTYRGFSEAEIDHFERDLQRIWENLAAHG